MLLLGGTGAGKSTLVNTMVNYFRGVPDLRKRLPARHEIKVAIPTLYLPATEKEGQLATELNQADRKCSCTLFLHTDMSNASTYKLLLMPDLSFLLKLRVKSLIRLTRLFATVAVECTTHSYCVSWMMTCRYQISNV